MRLTMGPQHLWELSINRQLWEFSLYHMAKPCCCVLLNSCNTCGFSSQTLLLVLNITRPGAVIDVGILRNKSTVGTYLPNNNGVAVLLNLNGVQSLYFFDSIVKQIGPSTGTGTYIYVRQGPPALHMIFILFTCIPEIHKVITLYGLHCSESESG